MVERTQHGRPVHPNEGGLKMYPVPRWLELKWSDERTDVCRRDELRASAVETLSRLDAWLAANTNGSGPRCHHCQSGLYAQVPDPCPACGRGSDPPARRRSSDAERLAAVRRALLDHRRDHVLVDGQAPEIEYRGGTILEIR